MPTTFKNLVPVRRIAVGDCLGPQGADGVSELARTAFAALLAADWTDDDAAPHFPVHEYDRAIPSGDAWKAVYGYDKTARAQRAACGAVCYTFAMPSDATAGTPANFSSFALSVVGDRYLDAGVDVYIVPSSSSAPPTVAQLLAGSPAVAQLFAETTPGTRDYEPVSGAPFCATSSQTDKPNERGGVTAQVSVSAGSTAAAYVHVVLLLHDYLGVRGAWIEGGAMLDRAAMSVEFSRDVSPDAEPGVRALRVTNNVEYSDTGGAGRREEWAYVELKLQYDYMEALDSTPADSEAESDIRQIASLAFDGPRSQSYGTSAEGGYMQTFGATSSSLSASASQLSLFAKAPLFYAPPRGGRMTAHWMSKGTAGNVDFALVQLGYEPPLHDGVSDVQLSDIAPIRQAIDGAGSDVLSIVRVSVPAGTNNSPVEFNVTFDFFRPERKYIAIVAIPKKIGAVVSYGDAPVLVQDIA